MFHVTDKPVRWAALLLMAVSLVVSAGRVVHAHVDGEHAHRLQTLCDADHCHFDTVDWHAHIWLFGIEVHIPMGDDGDLDSNDPPGSLSPSWSDMPTVVDVQPLATFGVEPSLDCVVQLVVSLQSPLDDGDDSPPHSGMGPGSAQRIWMSSLTL
jgi:hypothetical protein